MFQNKRYRPLFIDLAVNGLICVLIILFSQQLFVMTLSVASIIILRKFAFYKLVPGCNMKHEILFFTICTVIGSFNDWNSVEVRKIYNYTVPTLYPQLSTIPFWMFLFWGVILKTVSELSVFLKKSEINSSGRSVLLLLGLVVCTRLCIYSFYMRDTLSWLSFLIALITYFAVFGFNKTKILMAILISIIGTSVESILINFGKLHYYHLGVLAGVPIWIALWWSLIALIWIDVSAYIENKMQLNNL